MRSFLLPLAVLVSVTLPLLAGEPAPAPPGAAMLQDYFARQVAEIESTSKLPVPKSLAEWEQTRLAWRAELADMLGLNPMPERTPLQARTTGTVPGEGFVVENVEFQSMPGLYVTANFYLPEKVDHPLPAILYGCGHSDVKAQDGGSLGNKTYYQHHGEWFARHGYVCLVIDTVQLGEIRGEHHGTFNLGRWWWMARGYTPAGVEAWAGIRALDYLESRPEVDRTRLGMTGRSGGGAYSWWVAAMDDRVKVVVPTAGITNLRNYVVDGAVEGHCDCMFMVNTRRWDYDKVAALIAPRPLLIANTDKDTIFPLDGVMTVYNHVRALYKALGAEDKIGLQIAEGPHQDTQALNTGAFAWFERFLKGASPMDLIDEPAKKRLDPEVLRVFKDLPKDERNTTIDETFVKAAASIPVPVDAKAFEQQREVWMRDLREQVFAGWPKEAPALDLHDVGGGEKDRLSCHAWDFTSQEPWHLRLYVICRAGLKPGEVEHLKLRVLGGSDWPRDSGELESLFPVKIRGLEAGDREFKIDPLKSTNDAIVLFAPRGIGPTAWTAKPIDVSGITPRNDAGKMAEVHRLRRFYLLGQTLDGMRVWDIQRAVAALRAAGFTKPIELEGEGEMGDNALYASLFLPDVERVTLWEPTASHTAGPIYLNVLRYLDVPQAAAIAASRCEVTIAKVKKDAWDWTQQTAQKCGFEDHLHVAVFPPQK